MFIVLVLVPLGFGESLVTKCISMKNQSSGLGSTLVGSNPDDDELHCYPFIINLDRCDGSCNTVGDPFGRIFVSEKVEDIN